MTTQDNKNPVEVQESFYSLPYHWFPEYRLKKFEREVKREIIFNLLKSFSAQSIREYLDVGCGDGKWTTDIYEYLRKDNAKIKAIGIDISKRAVGFAKLISPFINFKSYSEGKLPVPSNKYDLVTCIEVIEHIPDEQEQDFIAELYRVTKHEGVMILTTPSIKEKISPHHFRHYSETQLKTLLSTAGFTNIFVTGQSIPLNHRLKWLRNWSNRLPFIWMLWKFSFKEKKSSKASNLIVFAKKL